MGYRLNEKYILGCVMGKRVALIDDDELYGEYVHSMISDYVSSATNFYEFDKFYSYFCDNLEEFDVIILDRFIGKYDVVKEDFVRHARKNGYKGKIILLSSVAKFYNEFDTSDLNFDLVVQKSSDTNWENVFTRLL